MQWNEVQALFPKQWVLLEELKSHYEGNKFIVDDVAVIRPIPEADIKHEFFAANNDRFVFHTSKESVVMELRDMPSIRRKIT